MAWTDGNYDVTCEVVGICDVIGVVRRQDGAGGVGECRSTHGVVCGQEGNNDVSGPEADWSMNWADP